MLLLCVTVVLALVGSTTASFNQEPSKISSSALLLPYLYPASNFRSAHRVTVVPGCYDWYSSDPLVVAVNVAPDDACPGESSSIVDVVAQVAEEPGKRMSKVVAVSLEEPTDADDCDQEEFHAVEVHVAPIDRIEILTTVRKLGVQDSETVSVQAFDADGNVFSTLEGLHFEWSASPDSPAGPLVISMLKETDVLSSSESLSRLESHNSFGSIIQVTGRATGQVKLTAKLTEPGYEGVQASVIISVTENIAVCPGARVKPLVFVPGAMIQFTYTFVRSGSGRRCEPAHDNLAPYGGDDGLGDVQQIVYLWEESSQGLVANVDARSGDVTYLAPGATSITLRDQVVTSNADTTNILVQEAHGADLSLLAVDTGLEEVLSDAFQLIGKRSCKWRSENRTPFLRALPAASRWTNADPNAPWILVRGSTYVVRGMLRTSGGFSVFFTTNMQTNFAYDPDASLRDTDKRIGSVSPLPTDLFGAHSRDLPQVQVVRAESLGWTHIHFEYSGIRGTSGKPVVAVSQLVWITDPIQVLDPPAMDDELVFDAHQGGMETTSHMVVFLGGQGVNTHTIKVNGGTGEYVFERLGDQKRNIIQLDGPTIRSSGTVGFEWIRVSDKNNPANFVNVLVQVLTPAGLSFPSGQVELQVGESMDVVVAASNSMNVQYTACGAFGDLLDPMELGGDANAAVLASSASQVPPTEGCFAKQLDGKGFGVVSVVARLAEASRKRRPGKRAQPSSTLHVAVFEPVRLSFGPTEDFLYSEDQVLGANGEGIQVASTVTGSFVVEVQGGPFPFDVATGAKNLDRFSENDHFEISRGLTHRLMRGSGGPKKRRYEFQCGEVGNVQVTLTVVNEKTDVLQSPRSLSRSFTVHCHDQSTHPASGSLTIAENYNLAPKIAEESPHMAVLTASESAQVTGSGAVVTRVLNGRTVGAVLELRDSLGARFVTVSKFNVQWAVSTVTYSRTPDYSPTHSSLLALRLLEAQGTGLMTVRANVNGDALRLTCDVDVVGPVRLVQQFGGRANLATPGARVRVFVQGGTNKLIFRVNQKPASLAVDEESDGRRFVVIPFDGDMSVPVVVEDVGFKAGTTDSTTVVFARVSSLVISATRTSLLLGRGANLDLVVRDGDAGFAPLAYESLEFHVDAGQGILALDTASGSSACVGPSDAETGDQCDGKWSIPMSGRGLGRVLVTATVTDPVSGSTVRSNKLAVSVFADLEVAPRKITLVPGASFQLQYPRDLGTEPGHGDDEPWISFNTLDSSVAVVDRAGLIQAKTQGTATVRATILVNGNVELSVVDVQVVVERLGHISVVSAVMGTGASSDLPAAVLEGEDVHLHVEGHPHHASLVSSPCNSYSWTVSDAAVVGLTSHDGSSEIRGDFTVWATGLAVGRTTITVKLNSRASNLDGTCGAVEATRPVATMELEVVPRLSLPYPSGSVLLPRNAEFQVETSFSGARTKDLDFELRRCALGMTLQACCDALEETKGESAWGSTVDSRSGVVSTGETLESVLVVVRTKRGVSAIEQQVSVLVEVVDVANVELGNKHLGTVVVGTEQQVDIIPFDRLGRAIDRRSRPIRSTNGSPSSKVGLQSSNNVRLSQSAEGSWWTVYVEALEAGRFVLLGVVEDVLSHVNVEVAEFVAEKQSVLDGGVPHDFLVLHAIPVTGFPDRPVLVGVGGIVSLPSGFLANMSAQTVEVVAGSAQVRNVEGRGVEVVAHEEGVVVLHLVGPSGAVVGVLELDVRRLSGLTVDATPTLSLSVEARANRVAVRPLFGAGGSAYWVSQDDEGDQLSVDHGVEVECSVQWLDGGGRVVNGVLDDDVLVASMGGRALGCLVQANPNKARGLSTHLLSIAAGKLRVVVRDGRGGRPEESTVSLKVQGGFYSPAFDVGMVEIANDTKVGTMDLYHSVNAEIAVSNLCGGGLDVSVHGSGESKQVRVKALRDHLPGQGCLVQIRDEKSEQVGVIVVRYVAAETTAGDGGNPPQCHTSKRYCSMCTGSGMADECLSCSWAGVHEQGECVFVLTRVLQDMGLAWETVMFTVMSLTVASSLFVLVGRRSYVSTREDRIRASGGTPRAYYPRTPEGVPRALGSRMRTT